MKILLLHDVQADKQNGVSVSLRILSRELKKLGYDIKVLTLSDNYKSYKADEDNYCLSSIPAMIYPGIRMRLYRHSRYVDELISWNPDIIHTNCEFSTFRIAKFIRKRCEKTPVWIHTFHTDYKYYIGFLKKSYVVREKMVPWYLNRCFGRSDALIVPTNKIYSYVSHESFDDGLNKNVIPTGIDFKELEQKADEDRAKTKAELGIPLDAKVIIFLGRISVEKNLDELVDCFAEYRKTHDNVWLLTVGDGPYKDSLIKKVEKAGVSDRVIVYGGVPHAEIRKFYNASDVFASASVSETQGLTFYEAMFCNLPVLAKDRECLADAIVEGENGAFFDSPETFGEALDKIINIREESGKNQSQLPECFQSEFFAKSVAKLYEKTLEEQKISRPVKKNAVYKMRRKGVKVRVKMRRSKEKIKNRIKHR